MKMIKRSLHIILATTFLISLFYAGVWAAVANTFFILGTIWGLASVPAYLRSTQIRKLTAD